MLSVEDWAAIRRLHQGGTDVRRVDQEVPGQQPPVGLQPRQDDQVNEGVDKQADRECIRTDPDGPLSEALTGCNQE